MSVGTISTTCSFSDYLVTDATGQSYKLQRSRWNAFIDLLFSALGFESTQDKLDGIYQEIYSGQPDRVFTGIRNLIDFTRKDIQSHFSLRFNNAGAFDVYFQNFKLVEVSGNPKTELVDLLAWVENKQQYTRFLEASVSFSPLHAFLVKLNNIQDIPTHEDMEALIADAKALQEGELNDFSQKLIMLNTLRNWPDAQTARNNALCQKMLNHELKIKGVYDPRYGAINHETTLSHLHSWAEGLSEYLSEINANLHILNITDLATQLQHYANYAHQGNLYECNEAQARIFTLCNTLPDENHPIATLGFDNNPLLSEGNSHLMSLYGMCYNTLEKLDNRYSLHSDIQHCVMKAFAQTLTVDNRASVALTAQVLQKFIPAIKEAEKLHIDLTTRSATAPFELAFAAEQVIINDVPDFLALYKTFAHEAQLPPDLANEHHILERKIIALTRYDDHKECRYQKLAAIKACVFTMYGNICHHAIEQLKTWTDILPSPHQHHHKAGILLSLRESLATFDGLRRQDGEYDFEPWDDFCRLQGRQQSDIDAWHEVILAANQALMQTKAP